MSKKTSDETPPSSLFDFLAKARPAMPEQDIAVVFVVENDETGESEEIPWDVTLRGWTSRERDDFEADNLRRAQAKSGNGTAKRGGNVEADLTNFRARLVSRSIIENGKRTFANSHGEQLLGDQPASVLDQLFSVCRKLHGMSDEDVETMTKNLPATADADSSSDSHSDSDEPSLN
jgi:hypothetical protein